MHGSIVLGILEWCLPGAAMTYCVSLSRPFPTRTNLSRRFSLRRFTVPRRDPPIRVGIREHRAAVPLLGRPARHHRLPAWGLGEVRYRLPEWGRIDRGSGLVLYQWNSSA